MRFNLSNISFYLFPVFVEHICCGVSYHIPRSGCWEACSEQNDGIALEPLVRYFFVEWCKEKVPLKIVEILENVCSNIWFTVSACEVKHSTCCIQKMLLNQL